MKHALAALAVLGSLVAAADYTYIISDHSSDERRSLPSAGIALDTGSAVPAEAMPLEARFRSWFASLGTTLKTNPFMGLVLILE